MGDTMHTTAAAVTSRKSSSSPAWHAVVLLGMIAALAAMSIRLHAGPHNGESHKIIGYLVVAAFEWTMAIWIAAGCRMQGESLSTLLGERSLHWRSIPRDCGLALGFLVTANLVLGLVQHLFASAPNDALRSLLPQTAVEIAAYLGLTVTAGFCEELIYRGYLLRQFTAWTGSVAAGLAIQSIVFGISHFYQGFGMAFTITVYGCLFGLLAVWRRSLRPGMIAHFVQDAVGGLLLARAVLK
jgi:membrane protease YdiL (CAAX protease family)